MTMPSVSGSFMNLKIRPLYGLLPFEDVNKVGSVEGVPSNADNRGLAKPREGGLIYRLIGQGARSGHDTDLTSSMDEPRHDSNLALIGFNDTGTVRPDHSMITANTWTLTGFLARL